MTRDVIRYWFEFDTQESRDARMMPWVGVSAWSLDDSKQLVRDLLFGGRELPSIVKLIEDVDIRDLDEKHVRRHMDPPNRRGIWYPVGYS